MVQCFHECFGFLFVFSGKPEMPEERDVGEIAETACGQADDGEARGTDMGSGRGGERAAAVESNGCTRPAGTTESVAFDQRVR